MELDARIESILFWKSEPLRADELSKALGVKKDEIEEALSILEKRLVKTGLRLIRKEDSVMLGTAPEASELIQKLQKEELSKDLGKATLETLTIILYESPVSKSDIDYVRGVNSGFILRSLLIRGLIEREANPKDKRTFLYRPTFDLLSFMGLAQVTELPEYGAVREEIHQFKKEFAVREAENAPDIASEEGK